MMCFNHKNTNAIGICKNCNKGLCEECLQEIENGIACKETCVEEVVQINMLIERNKKSYRNTSQSYMYNFYIYASLGIVMLIFGIYAEGIAGFISILGMLFFLAAVFNLVSAKKFRD